MKTERLLAIGALAISSAIFIVAVLGVAQQTYPTVGHDYYYFVPRLLDSYQHYQTNGLTIQWYTPSFGGGLPAYPNPQHMQFTLPALLMTAVDPWTAIWVTHVVYILAGLIAAYALFAHVLAYDPLASAIGALVFTVNGVVFSQAVVGHMGYQPFPLAAVAMLALFHRTATPVQKGCVIALVFAVHVHGAAFYPIVIHLLSAVIAVPLLLLLRPGSLDPRDTGRTLAVAAIAFALLCGSKLHAVFAFMEGFPRAITDRYGETLSEALRAVALQLFGLSGSGLFFPDRTGTARLLESTLLPLAHRYGIWEFDTTVSIAVLILLGLSAVGLAVTRRVPRMTGRTLVLALIALAGTWLVLEFRLTQGFVYPTLRDLPVARSLHVNLRFAAALILPLSMISAACFASLARWMPSRSVRAGIFVALVAVTLVPLSIYRHIRLVEWEVTYDISHAGPDRTAIANGLPPISGIADIRDSAVFRTRMSSLKPYEPLFGYHIEQFKPLVVPGSAHAVQDGYFNFTNPAGQVFPRENRLTPFERLKVNQRDQLDDLLAHRQPRWRRPLAQHILDWLMVLACVGVPVALTVGRKRGSAASRPPLPL